MWTTEFWGTWDLGSEGKATNKISSFVSSSILVHCIHLAHFPMDIFASIRILLTLLVAMTICSVCSSIAMSPKLPVLLAAQTKLNKDRIPLTARLTSYVPNSVKNGLASALAAAVVKFTLQPFDTIKTIQQMDAVEFGLFKTTLSFIEKRGILSLWAGVGVNVLGSAPSVALYFGVFNSAKVRLAAVLPPAYRPLAVALAAMIGNTFASVLRVPYEVSCLCTGNVCQNCNCELCVCLG